MKAAVYFQYGPPEVVSIQEVEKPVPQKDQVLIRVLATAVNSADVRLRKADPFLVRLVFGLFKPRTHILGTDVAGIVESVGPDALLFKPGDEVFGSTYESGMAAHAEFALIAESSAVAKKPANLSYNEAAAVFFGGNTALHFLRRGGIGNGSKVLVYGASGAVGTWAVQLANHFGAEVHAVTSTRNLELVKSIGARKVIDYTKEDFSKHGEQYHIIFDTVGKSPFMKCMKSLSSSGKYLRAVHTTPGPLLAGLWINLVTRKKVIGGMAYETKEDLEFLKTLIENSDIRPVIDRIYPFEEIVDAHRYVEKGHKRGNVVIRIV